VDLSPRLRIVGLAVVLALLALGAGFLLLGRSQGSSSAAVKTIKPLHAGVHHVRRTTTPVAAKHARKTRARRAAARPAVIDGMPAALAHALEQNNVVVVSLYAPRSSVDQLASAEAQHGADVSGAGFVALNVANEKVVAPLTAILAGAQTAADRVLDDPAVLVFQRPRTLFVRLNGFADSDTVAQAASNAGAVKIAAPAGGGWASQADAVCTEMAGEVQALPFPSSAAEAVTWIDSLDAVLSRTVSKLHGIPAPPGRAGQVRQMLAAYDQALAGLHTLLEAAKHGQKIDSDAVQKRTATLGERADAMARDLGATACGGGLLQ
jgi:hypothetical protein